LRDAAIWIASPISGLRPWRAVRACRNGAYAFASTITATKWHIPISLSIEQSEPDSYPGIDPEAEGHGPVVNRHDVAAVSEAEGRDLLPAT
jgi:hypothetical protein